MQKSVMLTPVAYLKMKGGGARAWTLSRRIDTIDSVPLHHPNTGGVQRIDHV